MPEILLFDISEPQSGDGVSTGGVYPSRIRWVIVPPRENFKSTPKMKASPAISLYIYGSRSGKTGLNDNNFDFHFSTFSIRVIFYDLSAKRTMSLTLLIA